MAMMNGQGPPGQPPMTGQQRGMKQQAANQAAQNQDAQLVQRLRQMDNEQLVRLVLQLRNRLNEVAKMQQRTAQKQTPQQGQSPNQGGRQRR